jgi:rubrerythrin
MPYDFNAEEMFDVAIRIEQNGARFYRKAAEHQSSPESQAELEKLATMEDRHESTFEKMKQQISDAQKRATVFDPWTRPPNT